MISHRNLVANFRATHAGLRFVKSGGAVPPGASWSRGLPFYHDMGLMLGIAAPILDGCGADLLSRSGSWHARRDGCRPWPGIKGVLRRPNFAFDLTARRTTDAELEDLDLQRRDRHHQRRRAHPPSTLVRFNERFSPVGFRPEMVLPSYGLAEATVFVASGSNGRPRSRRIRRRTTDFGHRRPHSRRCAALAVWSPDVPAGADRRSRHSSTLSGGHRREIWTHGRTSRRDTGANRSRPGRHSAPHWWTTPAGFPETRWLRTGDRGFISEVNCSSWAASRTC